MATIKHLILHAIINTKFRAPTQLDFPQNIHFFGYQFTILRKIHKFIYCARYVTMIFGLKWNFVQIARGFEIDCVARNTVCLLRTNGVNGTPYRTLILNKDIFD